MALSIFDDPPTGVEDPNEPTTVKRFASKKLKQRPIGAPQNPEDDAQQLSSMMPGKPTSAYRGPTSTTDQDKRLAIRRRLRRPGIN
jgi:hypothetical protein